MLRVLLTNDDGIQADGLRALAAQLGRWCDVTVVAPDNPSSATSHSITLHKPLRMYPEDHGYEEYSTAAVTAYSCSGTPSDCVMLGVLHLLKDNPPGLVISGINDGMNVAQDLTYSGTVGGALEGAILGIPSIAVSLAGLRNTTFIESAQLVDAIISVFVLGGLRPELTHLAPHLGLTSDAGSDSAGRQHTEVQEIQTDWLPADYAGDFCLNINLPDTAPGNIEGLRWTRAGHRIYKDIIRISQDPNGRPYYWIGGKKVLDRSVPLSDTSAISDNFISLTPITYDITQRENRDTLEAWFAERYLSRGGQ